MLFRIDSIGAVAMAVVVTAPALLMTSLFSGGCSSSSSTTGGSDSGAQGTLSAETACTDSAHATCLTMQTCTPANLEATYGDEAACEARNKATCVAALAAPSAGSSANETEACALAVAHIACADYRNKTNIPMACVQGTGSRANGAGCLYPAQCSSGFCAITPGSTCGACAAPPKQGDSCAALASCGQTLTCTTDTLVCTVPAAQGEPCGPGQPCGASLSCVAPGGAGTAGTCQPAGTMPGVPCDGNLKTGPSCDNALGLFCDGVTKQCAQATYASGGQPCGYSVDAGTLVNCTSGTCVGSDPTAHQLGQCMARAADDGPCVVPDGGAATPSAGCLPAARCIAATGTCQVIAASSCE
ncbi:MAG: hypothetical protein JOZ69_17625 [Myxococcales bacterium]|nr:hypothetical protein [Myxococcales bacterium]